MKFTVDHNTRLQLQRAFAAHRDAVASHERAVGNTCAAQHAWQACHMSQITHATIRLRDGLTRQLRDALHMRAAATAALDVQHAQLRVLVAKLPPDVAKRLPAM